MDREDFKHNTQLPGNNHYHPRTEVQDCSKRHEMAMTSSRSATSWNQNPLSQASEVHDFSKRQQILGSVAMPEVLTNWPNKHNLKVSDFTKIHQRVKQSLNHPPLESFSTRNVLPVHDPPSTTNTTSWTQQQSLEGFYTRRVSETDLNVAGRDMLQSQGSACYWPELSHQEAAHQMVNLGKHPNYNNGNRIEPQALDRYSRLHGDNVAKKGPTARYMADCGTQTTHSSTETTQNNKSVDVGTQASPVVSDSQCQTTEQKHHQKRNSKDFDPEYIPPKKKEKLICDDDEDDDDNDNSPSTSIRDKADLLAPENVDNEVVMEEFYVCEDDPDDEEYDSPEWDSKHPRRKRKSLKKTPKPKPSLQEIEAAAELKLRKPFKCPYCYKRFIKESSLSNHTLNSCTKNRSGNDFICSECGDHFVMFSLYKKHLKTHSGEFYKCTCGDKFENYIELKSHVDTPHPEGETHAEVHPYACRICFKTFIHQGRFKRHMITHDNNAKIACSVCGKEYEKGYMEIHERTHSGVKPFICEHKNCGLNFPSKKLLQRHQRWHYDEFRMSCTYCDKVFTQKSRLKDHLRVHTGEKPYVCEICGISFSRTNHLHRHKLAHFKKDVESKLQQSTQLLYEMKREPDSEPPPAAVVGPIPIPALPTIDLQ